MLTETRPALVPLTFDGDRWSRPAAGRRVAADGVDARAARPAFREALLFTHRGLSGPAILQISSYWRDGDDDRASTCCPDRDVLPHC